MTTGIPELGIKISLISKANIRYEGQLYSVDPQECTIALASVRSFGTEDRDAQFQVPGQNQVQHPQPLNDPAIMQLSVRPSLGAQPYQQHPILGHMGHTPYGSFLPMGGLTSTGAPGLQPGMNRAGSSAGGSKPSSVLDFIGGGAASQSTTPASVGSRKSLSVDQGTETGGSQQTDKRQVKPIQPPGGGQHQQRNKSRKRRNSGNQSGIPRVRRSLKGGPFRLGAAGNKRTLIFDTEYDFEKANAEFMELMSKSSKVKNDEAGSSKPEVKGPTGGESEKKGDSGNETGAVETEQEGDHKVYYDKTKSFFDKISCEAVERAKGKMQRTDWRKERILNAGSYGIAVTRRRKGGYHRRYRYPQQRRNSDQQQQQTNQQNQQDRPMAVYIPLTGEEALSKRQEDGKVMQINEKPTVSAVQTEKPNTDDKDDGSKTEDSVGLKEQIIIAQEPLEQAKIHKDSENVVAADPPACISQ